MMCLYSGGPVIIQLESPVQIGIVSFGSYGVSGNTAIPSINTDVSYFQPWIIKT